MQKLDKKAVADIHIMLCFTCGTRYQNYYVLLVCLLIHSVIIYFDRNYLLYPLKYDMLTKQNEACLTFI